MEIMTIQLKLFWNYESMGNIVLKTELDSVYCYVSKYACLLESKYF